MSAPKPDPRHSGLTPLEHENLSAYLDHELDEVGTEAITAALSRRPEVRKEAERLRKTWEMLDYLPRPQAPKSFTEQTLTRLNSTKGLLMQQGMRWRRYAIAGWAACVVTAAAFGFWLTYSFNRDPEIVEVQTPETDVIPVLEKATPEPPPATEIRIAKKDAKNLQRIQDTQRRNERLAREFSRLFSEVRKKLNEEEEDRLIRLSRRGGLPYMAALIELANKYKIPLVDPNDAAVPGKANKKTAGKGKEAGE